MSLSKYVQTSHDRIIEESVHNKKFQTAQKIASPQLLELCISYNNCYTYKQGYHDW